MRRFILLVTLFFLASQSFTARGVCYYLYDNNKQLIQSGQIPPFDISLPQVSTDYAKSQSRGEHLVIAPSESCESFVKTAASPPTPATPPIVSTPPAGLPPNQPVAASTEPVANRTEPPAPATPLTPSTYVPTNPSSTSYLPSSGYRPGCAENGSCYGDISPTTGRPKTTHVQSYYRKDGTYVRGHYRSSGEGRRR